MPLFRRLVDLPEPFASFIRARRRWVATWLDPRADPDAARAFDAATDDLRARVRARGGKLEAGGVIFKLDESGGVEIEEVPSCETE